MARKLDSVRDGVAEGFDFWLSQHPISVPEMFQEAIERAVGNWMDAHEDEVLEALGDVVKVYPPDLLAEQISEAIKAALPTLLPR